MYRLERRFRFEAAHRLPNHQGKCFRLHGHSWQGVVTIEDYELHSQGSESGMVMDFGHLSLVLTPLIEGYLDHHYLNETTGLEHPTSECLAKWIFDYLKPKLTEVTLVSVRVEETCTCAATYSESPRVH